jgi:CBS domain-containing protein
MPKCSDVMTPDPACCEPDDSVKNAAKIMKQHDVGAVPVVESHASRRLVGMVTDRDLAVRVLAGDRNSEQATLRDAMSGNPVACRTDDDVQKALQLMAERQLRRMPVVDQSGRLMGIIAQADIATRVGSDKQTGELVEAISEPAGVRK